MSDQEERKLDLIDELWAKLDDLEPNQGPGSLLGFWAGRALDFETDERAALLGFLEHAGVSKSLIDMCQKGVHRQRSTKAMTALKNARSMINQERRAAVNKLVCEYVGGSEPPPGSHK